MPHDDPTPTLRRTCQWCNSGKHAVQYQALILERLSEATTTEYHRPGVCLVCPRCDSPGPSVA